MKPGVGWILAGVVLLGAGLAVTFLSKQVAWYGAIIVGVIWIGRGVYRLVQSSKSSPENTPD